MEEDDCFGGVCFVLGEECEEVDVVDVVSAVEDLVSGCLATENFWSLFDGSSCYSNDVSELTCRIIQDAHKGMGFPGIR